MYAPKDHFHEPPREPPPILYYRRRRKRRPGKMRKFFWIALIVLLGVGAGVAFATMRQPPNKPPQTLSTNIIAVGEQVIEVTIKPPVAGAAFGSQSEQIFIYGQHGKTVQYSCTVLSGNQASESLTLKYQLLSGGIRLEEIDGCFTLAEILQKQPARPILVNGGIPLDGQNVRSQTICLAPPLSSSVTVSVFSAQHGLKVEGQGQHACP